MKNIFSSITCFVLLFFFNTSPALADCAANDAPCLAAMAAEAGSSAGSAAALVGVAAAGVVYVLLREPDSKEEAELMWNDFRQGKGIRLNNHLSKFRMSLFPQDMFVPSEKIRLSQPDNALGQRYTPFSMHKDLEAFRISFDW